MVPADPGDIGEMVARARQGEREALEGVLATIAPSIHRFGLRMCKNVQDAEDVLQDTLINVANHLASPLARIDPLLLTKTDPLPRARGRARVCGARQRCSHRKGSAVLGRVKGQLCRPLRGFALDPPSAGRRRGVREQAQISIRYVGPFW